MVNQALSRVVATVFYVGYLRPAPGTWGSLVAALLAIPLIYATSLPGLLVAIVVAYVAGHWATSEMTREGPHDPSEIVIDEVAGQWVTLIPLALVDYMHRPQALDTFWEAVTQWGTSVALAFVLFRVFDILKPWPVSWADRRSDATGVMLDDVIAGVLGAIVLTAIFQFALWYGLRNAWS